MKLGLGLFGTLRMAGLLAVAMAACPALAADSASPDVAMSLERSACYGSCPVYRVTIHGDGRVQFTTRTSPVHKVDAIHRQFSRSRGVLVSGTLEDRVSPEAAQALLAQFEAAGFWQLKDEYRAYVTDLPTQVITLAVGDRQKSVTDYDGRSAGMPLAAHDLEAAIDRVAGTERWVTGGPGLVPWLERNGFDFRSTGAAELAVNGEDDSADEATVLSLIDHGAPLDRPLTFRSRFAERTGAAGTMLMEASIRRGHAGVFARLAAAGWLDRLGKTKAAELLSRSAAGCSPALVDAAADAGVDIDYAVFDPREDDDDQGKTALAELAGTYTCREQEPARIQTADRLLARGANPNHRDKLGRTPLYGVENPQLLEVLLAHGADATVKSKNGRSMVFGSWTDAIVLRLLEAGASPVGRYDYDGKTLKQKAKASMPLVAQWLAAHPESFRR
ncbi:DUF6438 domain-containing protein [Dyella sp. BiH032]|uniref:DUF6438 domain-containing protein n=1 Tax=Dyella sp. BiH032 TaxID=3075430 RepID=UPI00289333F6|nr:DUF6438 domain-containing protein [Dyella sp. BiH032]WNL45778.1 DUF6438 domain-containing protein [Dyella sp. BiH032]